MNPSFDSASNDPATEEQTMARKGAAVAQGVHAEHRPSKPEVVGMESDQPSPTVYGSAVSPSVPGKTAEPCSNPRCRLEYAHSGPCDTRPREDYCGCCGRPCGQGEEWCEDCKGHVLDDKRGQSSPPWMRTYSAQHEGKPCPFQEDAWSYTGDHSGPLHRSLDALPNWHDLKCWPEPFEAIVRGDKRHEVRHDDRGFSLGDFLRLREWNPIKQQYTGRSIDVTVTYIVRGGHGAGLERVPEDIAVMSIAPASVHESGEDDFDTDGFITTVTNLLRETMRGRGTVIPLEEAIAVAAEGIRYWRRAYPQPAAGARTDDDLAEKFQQGWQSCWQAVFDQHVGNEPGLWRPETCDTCAILNTLSHYEASDDGTTKDGSS